jgi:glycosyltransferase involved in cell wall biosynthesis
MDANDTDSGTSRPKKKNFIAVVIPSFRVKGQILRVIERVPAECGAIYVVDDACPEASGKWVSSHCHDSRVKILFHSENRGVGGATITGMRQAVTDGAEILVKIDGDGQMDPVLLPNFTAPIESGRADYVKGNRFFDLRDIQRMPKIRLLGNAALSFLSKFSSGYWDIFDPTNGYCAISARTFALLPTEKISARYFFESDMLFRLYLARAVVLDVPMHAVYADEKSSLKVGSVLIPFLFKHARNCAKRVLYSYFLRDFSVASIELALGIPLMIFGTVFGAIRWIEFAALGREASAGTVMLAALPIILGFQMILSFLAYDYRNVPKVSLMRLGF